MAGFHPVPVDMGNDIWLIDLHEQGVPYRTGAYLIRDKRLTLVETGSATSHETLLNGLAALDVRPEDLAYVIVTHVHLDHAGGAGQLLAKARDAKLVVHPRGARHMIDPSRLWAGAGQVYGDRLASLFGSVQPVPEDRVLVRDHGDQLSLGERTLTFFDSPGHAKHHFTILDSMSRVLFAGDAVGVRYKTEFTGWGFEFIMPSTSPVDFDPAAIHRTLDMLAGIDFDWVYHAHFGKSPKQEAIHHTRRCADEMARLIGDLYRPGIPVEEVVQALRKWIVSDLQRQGHQPGNNIEVLDVDVILDAMGLIYYEERRRQERTS